MCVSGTGWGFASHHPCGKPCCRCIFLQAHLCRRPAADWACKEQLELPACVPANFYACCLCKRVLEVGSACGRCKGSAADRLTLVAVAFLPPESYSCSRSQCSQIVHLLAALLEADQQEPWAAGTRMLSMNAQLRLKPSPTTTRPSPGAPRPTSTWACTSRRCQMCRSPTRRARPPQSRWCVSGSWWLPALQDGCVSASGRLLHAGGGSSQAMRASLEALGCAKLLP